MNNLPKFISECMLDVLNHAQDEKIRKSFADIKGSLSNEEFLDVLSEKLEGFLEQKNKPKPKKIRKLEADLVPDFSSDECVVNNRSDFSADDFSDDCRIIYSKPVQSSSFHENNENSRDSYLSLQPIHDDFSQESNDDDGVRPIYPHELGDFSQDSGNECGKLIRSVIAADNFSQDSDTEHKQNISTTALRRYSDTPDLKNLTAAFDGFSSQDECDL